MTIQLVAVDESVKASTMNAVINHVNDSPGMQAFFSSGVFTVPAGVYKLKVTLCGSGGASYTYSTGGEDSQTFYFAGGAAPMVSTTIAVEAGASHAVTIGAAVAGNSGQPGGTSSFGGLSSTGGTSASSGTSGTHGTATGAAIYQSNILCNSAGIPYGGTDMPGVVLIEW